MFGDYYPMETTTFGSTLVTCYGSPSLDPMNPYTFGTFENPLPDVLFTMLLAKYHGWIGGFSSILVIAIGLILFAVCRQYIKWRITLVYLVITAVLSVVMGGIYGGDIIFRLVYHVFTGSSIFMAFFMATDPATTPLTHLGQIIFGAGLAILTIVIQTYTGFLGGSILALVIMNLTCPLLDRVGVPKARKERRSCGLLPKAKTFSKVRITECIRCGQCLYVCTGRIPTVSIKEAVEKGDWTRVKKLGAEYCQQCGTCSFVCPARIDLKGIMLAAREKIKKQ
jgi:ferredoxin